MVRSGWARTAAASRATATGRFTRVTRADGLPSDLIRSLYVDADGWLWVGTEGRGLARLDPRAWDDGQATPKRAIVRIGTKDGLFDEVIHQILEDDAGRLWMNTNRGIFWVPRAELNAFADGRLRRIHSTAYSERDGMRNREGNGGVQPAGAKGPDGRLWFPTQDGVVVVDPAKVRRDQLAPPLVVEQVVAGGRSASPGARLDRARARPARRADRVHGAHVPRAGERPLPLPARSVRRGLGRRGKPPHGVLHEGAAGAIHVPRRGERRRRRVVRAGNRLAVRVLPRVWETRRLPLGRRSRR